MTYTQIERQVDLLRVILNTKGKIFRVTFIKRTNGERRNLIGRLGVTRGVKGVGLKFHPLGRGLLVLYDMHKHAFRMLNLESLRAVKFRNRLFTL